MANFDNDKPNNVEYQELLPNVGCSADQNLDENLHFVINGPTSDSVEEYRSLGNIFDESGEMSTLEEAGTSFFDETVMSSDGVCEFIGDGVEKMLIEENGYLGEFLD